MSQIMGDKIALSLKAPSRCRMLYQILLKERPIGEIELDQIAWRSGEAELKIEIFDSFLHRHGYGTDAVTTLVEHAFLTMNMNRVYLRVHATNECAIRCYEKAGFKKLGRLRRTITDGNTREEILLMGISRKDFHKQEQCRAV
ncbi:MAG TPA: GNAT family N-acetyltransferase [Firmicutes bacterium]|jgi:RimJ/RimL family protein N-acetyltransferase|nr:GNAT family protein [Bacillota bacterium]HHT42721.1 GNAT family N-acetyltransferase [Bacillota bacterium]